MPVLLTRCKLVFFICFLYSLNSFSQKVIYRNLIGIWDNEYWGNGKAKILDNFRLYPESLLFTDSILIRTDSTYGYGNASHCEKDSSKFTLDTSFNITVIRLQKKRKNGDMITWNWYIKILDNDTLKIQRHGGGITKYTPWDDETYPETKIYFRRK